MKATINVEYSGEEIEKLAFSLAGRLLAKLGGVINPADAPTFLALMQQGMEMAMSQMQPQRAKRAPGPRPNGAFPFGESSVGPFGGPIPRGQGSDNVQPIREPGHVDRCFPIEATRHVEAGIGCCACATYNGTQRVHCRNCGHKLCVIETPPPAEEAPA